MKEKKAIAIPPTLELSGEKQSLYYQGVEPVPFPADKIKLVLVFGDK